jgi:hypothetical protein
MRHSNPRVDPPPVELVAAARDAITSAAHAAAAAHCALDRLPHIPARPDDLGRLFERTHPTPCAFCGFDWRALHRAVGDYLADPENDAAIGSFAKATRIEQIARRAAAQQPPEPADWTADL